MVAPDSTSGTSPVTILRASPSAMAVLPTPGIADQQRVVLGAAAEDLDGALHLGHPPDQGVDLAGAGLLVEVDAVGLQRLAAGLGVLLLGALFGGGALDVAGLRGAGLLGDAVGDEVDRVVAGHVLLLQEEGRMALPLGEHRHQHVGAGHLVAARGLHVDHRALDHPLEAGGGLGVLAIVHDQRTQFGVQVVDQVLLQHRQVDVAGAHDGGRLLVVSEAQQQVLERRILVLALVGVGHGAVEGLFEVAREGRHGRALNPFPWCTGAGADGGAPCRPPEPPWSRRPRR